MAEETKIEEVKKSSLNASVAPEEFDWDAFEGNAEIYGNADKASIEAAYDQTLSKVVENEVVEGVVTAISKREVIVNIGYKSEGVIQAPEFRYNPDLKVGDKVEVYVESAEDKKGQLILSHKKARALKSWDRVNEAFTADDAAYLAGCACVGAPEVGLVVDGIAQIVAGVVHVDEDLFLWQGLSEFLQPFGPPFQCGGGRGCLSAGTDGQEPDHCGGEYTIFYGLFHFLSQILCKFTKKI